MSQRPYRSPDGQAVGSVNNDPNNPCRHPQDQTYKVGECHSGCCTDYRCKACDRVFRFEWPD